MPLEEECIIVPTRRGRRATRGSTGLGQDAEEGARGMHRSRPLLCILQDGPGGVIPAGRGHRAGLGCLGPGPG